jgi:TRAP-type C4-dicarboxylate transport system permease small subunit
MERFYRAMVACYRVAAVAMLWAMIGILFIAIVLREGFGTPLVWAIEVSLTLFVWMVFLGAGLGMTTNSHIRILELVKLLPRPVRASVALLLSYVGLAVLVALIVYGAKVAYDFRGHRFTTLEVSAGLTWLALPVGLLLMLVGWIRYGVWTARASLRAVEKESDGR